MTCELQLLAGIHDAGMRSTSDVQFVQTTVVPCASASGALSHDASTQCLSPAANSSCFCDGSVSSPSPKHFLNDVDAVASPAASSSITVLLPVTDPCTHKRMRLHSKQPPWASFVEVPADMKSKVFMKTTPPQVSSPLEPAVQAYLDERDKRHNMIPSINGT